MERQKNPPSRLGGKKKWGFRKDDTDEKMQRNPAAKTSQAETWTRKKGHKIKRKYKQWSSSPRNQKGTLPSMKYIERNTQRKNDRGHPIDDSR